MSFQGSLTYPIRRGIKHCKCMVILRDFPYFALFGLVSYNDPCYLLLQRSSSEDLEERHQNCFPSAGVSQFFVGATSVKTPWISWAKNNAKNREKWFNHPAPSKGCQLNPKGWWIDTLQRNHLAPLWRCWMMEEIRNNRGSQSRDVPGLVNDHIAGSLEWHPHFLIGNTSTQSGSIFQPAMLGLTGVYQKPCSVFFCSGTFSFQRTSLWSSSKRPWGKWDFSLQKPTTHLLFLVIPQTVWSTLGVLTAKVKGGAKLLG